MTDRPTFSVVIPSYNYAHFLGVTLDSIVQQQRNDVETILVDDASTDDTPQVAARYPHVHYVRLPRNSGPGEAWTTGLRAATGLYVSKLDADDWLLPGWFDLVESAFEADPEVGLVAGGAVLYRDAGELLDEPVTDTDRVLSAAELRALLLRDFFFRMPSMSLRAAVLDDTAPPRSDLRLPHDWEYVLRATRGWKGALLAERLGVYRVHTSSLTVTSRHESRLLHDFERFVTYISNPDDPAHLEPPERSVLITAMARSYLGSVGPRLSLRHPAAVRSHLAAADRIAARAGWRARAALARYLAWGVARRLTRAARPLANIQLPDLLPAGYSQARTHGD